MQTTEEIIAAFVDDERVDAERRWRTPSRSPRAQYSSTSSRCGN
jgi:hypothetical protein